MLFLSLISSALFALISAKAVHVEDVFFESGQYQDFGNVTTVRRLVPPPKEHMSLVLFVFILYFCLILFLCFWKKVDRPSDRLPKDSVSTGYTNVAVTETIDL